MPLADLGVTKGKAEHGAWAPGTGASLLALSIARAGLKLGKFWVWIKSLDIEEGHRRAGTERETSLSSLKKYLYG